MAYQTGTSTGPDDLLDKLRIFLVADGWSQNDHSSDGTGYRLHVEKTPSSVDPTLYFNLRSATSEWNTAITGDNDSREDYGKITGIVVNGSLGYDGGEDWDEQPGFPYSADYGTDQYSFGMVITPMSTSAIPAYYFFTVGNTVNIVVECSSGKFQFMSFGLLNKEAAGVYDGGMFFSASYNSRMPYYNYNVVSSSYVPHYFAALRAGNSHGAVYVDADGTADWRVAEGDAAPEVIFPCVVSGNGISANYCQAGIASHYWAKAPNSYNNISAGCPIYMFLKRSDNNYSLLGYPDGVRFMNILNYSVGQEVTYGTETWKIFKENSIKDDDNIVNEYCGFEFKKVA